MDGPGIFYPQDLRNPIGVVNLRSAVDRIPIAEMVCHGARPVDRDAFAGQQIGDVAQHGHVFRRCDKRKALLRRQAIKIDDDDNCAVTSENAEIAGFAVFDSDSGRSSDVELDVDSCLVVTLMVCLSLERGMAGKKV